MSVVRSPLGRARGMGSAKHGVGHFIAQRVTAIALIILLLWAALNAIGLAHGDYETAAGWLRSPVNAALTVLLAFAAFWHMSIGMRVIIEDYFQKTGTKAALLVINIFVCWVGGALTILSILKVALGPAGASI
ncbi:MAG TPA: succinate dehydrogenase, hydrophobic membrane anchor protein [Caulobacteraceae bacterium]|jgi:succinate dehydrogenase / fumarate reductase membrane anchor subunit